MICPKCNKEMIEGYIPSGKMAVLFVPSSSGKMPKTIYGIGENNIQLTKSPLWKMQKAEAHYCSNCKVVIVPVKNLD